MKLIALEEHFTTPAIAATWAALPADLQDPVTSMADGGEIGSRLQDLGEQRLRQMDDCGVDVQVLSLTTPGAQPFEPSEAREIARTANNLLAEAVKRYPDRFDAFATLPTPDPAASADELDRCVSEFGFKGALLSPRTRDRSLDQPEYLPLLERAARLKVPLQLHPQSPAPAVREVYYSGFDKLTDTMFAGPGFGWHADTGLYALRLIFSGVFDRLPDLQIILGHWGEVVLFYLDRIDSMGRVAKHLAKPISEYFRSNFYVAGSGILSQRYLLQSIDLLGIDRIVYSTDYPYRFAPGGEARRFLMEAPIEDEAKRKIAHGNWERLTGR